ncbi:biotin--[acetyl-CoA-carboxylase] ligase [Clostridium sediminicola]|uniref:biotin--[acetyl-CoA-carboxylase] ligase n=1 Tax=Clostridium sediminicola TaxID=3114879 RepID=UPI0031F25A06
MKQKILELLKRHFGEYISGQIISEKLGISRAAVWKHMNALKEDGYEIESVSRKGYRIISTPDVLTYNEIEDLLKTESIGRKIEYYKSLDSTNNFVKSNASRLEDGTVIISEEQTAGRGRLGRYWVSPMYKGVWMSIILRPDLNPIYVSKITQVAAAAVNKAFSDLGIENKIKWPNDIIVNNKKVCGILTEMNAEMNRVNFIVVGIGINVNLDIDDIPEDIRYKATSLKIEKGIEISRKEVVSRILNTFEELYRDFAQNNDLRKSIDICRDNSILINREVKIIERTREYYAKVTGLNEEGHLVIIDNEGKTKELLSGEVSVRNKEGYI